MPDRRSTRTLPISQVEIEQEILRLVGELEDENELYEGLITDASEKEASYKKKWASEYLRSSGPVKERESIADFRADDHFHLFKIADGLVRAKREKLQSIRTAIDALRTLNANVRSLTTNG